MLIGENKQLPDMIFHNKLKLLHRLLYPTVEQPQCSALPRAFVYLKRNNHQQFF